MKKRILIADFKHETNSFSPIVIDKKAFEDVALLYGEDVFTVHKTMDSEVHGFLDTLNSDEFELVPSISFDTFPSGKVTDEVFDLAVNEILNTIKNKGAFDGILLSLHGAMVAQSHYDCEGDILEKIRQVVGYEMPIIVSLDLHANVTEKMFKNATLLIPYKNYPHTDVYETGVIAANCMKDILLNNAKYYLGYRRIPYLLPLFPTELLEIAKFYKKADEFSTDENVKCVRISHGFFPSDIKEMGMSVLAVVKDDKEKAQKIADELYDEIFSQKETLKRHYISLDDALDKICDDKIIVLADASDNTGSGTPGDSTHILRRILERKITGGAFASITDSKSVALCKKAGIGATVTLDLGGQTDKVFSGGPIHTKAKVLNLTDGHFVNKDEIMRGYENDMGDTAVVEINGNKVIIASNRIQPWDMEAFRSQGIEPTEQKFLVVKSAVHYRNSFGKIADEMIELALSGYAVPVPDNLPYKNWKEN